MYANCRYKMSDREDIPTLVFDNGTGMVKVTMRALLFKI